MAKLGTNLSVLSCWPHQQAATKDKLFIILGFTAENGEPLLCAVIATAKTMKYEWATGFDPLVEWMVDEQDFIANSSTGKAYPYDGPVCIFWGKEVPCFCFNSASGSINGALLTAMLLHIDNRQVFDCSAGINPFLLLDGHSSHFEPEFLEYINCK